MASKAQRQQILIDYISQHPQSQISDFVHKFREYQITITERTILRDIDKLLEQHLIVRSGSGKNTHYSISAQQELLTPLDVDAYFEQDYLKRPVKEQFNFDIFDTLQYDIFTNSEQDKLDQLQSDFIAKLARYDSQTIINKEYERIMIEFSWKSSEIEGNTYSLLDTEALIKNNIPNASKTQEETQMILNHKDAFNESIQHKADFLTLKLDNIEYIHRTLTKQIGIAPNLRKEGVGITGTRYRPLDNQFQIQEAMSALIHLTNTTTSFFKKALIMLIMISYIQPFEDGNKRTARMMSNAILLAHNSIPLSYRIVDVVEYKKATILFYERNNLSYFKQIFIEQFEDAVQNYFISSY